MTKDIYIYLFFIILFFQGTTTDTDPKKRRPGFRQQSMDYLEEPGGRPRAMSVASILTNTMEGLKQGSNLDLLYNVAKYLISMPFFRA